MLYNQSPLTGSRAGAKKSPLPAIGGEGIRWYNSISCMYLEGDVNDSTRREGGEIVNHLLGVHLLPFFKSSLNYRYNGKGMDEGNKLRRLQTSSKKYGRPPFHSSQIPFMLVFIKI